MLTLLRLRAISIHVHLFVYIVNKASHFSSFYAAILLHYKIFLLPDPFLLISTMLDPRKRSDRF